MESAIKVWSRYRGIKPWTLPQEECLRIVGELRQAMQDCSDIDLHDRVGMENLYEHLLSWTGLGHEMLLIHHGEAGHPAGHVWMWELWEDEALATQRVKVVLPPRDRERQPACIAQASRLIDAFLPPRDRERQPAWIVTDGQAAPASMVDALATARMFQGGEDSPWPPMQWDMGLIFKATIRHRRGRV